MIRLTRCLGVTVAGLALAGVAQAQDKGVNLTTGATSLKLGGELRAELLYNNHGLNTTDAKKADASETIETQTANLKLDGKFNTDTEFAARFNLLNPVKNGKVQPLDYGYGTHWFNKMVGWSFGKMTVLQGGFDHIDGNYRAHAVGVYANNLVYDMYEPMTALHVKAGGTITLQLLNDKVSGHDAWATWNEKAHPTFVLGYRGEFGPISPLLDLGSYDNNKSRWLDVGVKTEMNGLLATLDYYNNNHVVKYPDSTGKAKGLADVATSITLYAEYAVKGSVTPWFYFSTYDNKQDASKDYGHEDHKYNNTRDANGTLNYASAEWDDNGQTIGVGVNLDMMGKGWTPYVALVNQSGKFEDDKKVGEAKSKSEMWVRIGCLGEI